MKTKDHPVYIDYARFMNSRELRQLRRILRQLDKLIINEAKKRNRILPVNVRIKLAYELWLQDQERRNFITNPLLPSI